MAQKDKIKELVGRSLNSYHTKALQQMDRIEKKNKEQNHKISILSNELDNDYLTKTEEGSVISLEHSKEGMIYLDELQGNTLVNYCTDGSKELTLNGDIDVEGTFVTTTEGVDNGLVDVMCEGNTLVNLKLNSGEKCGVSWQNSNTVNYFTLSENSSIHLKGEIIETSNVLQFGWCYAKLGKFNTKLLKPNTTYTIILDNHYDWLRVFSLMEGNATNAYHKSCAKISKNIYTVTTKDNFEGLNDEHIILYGSIDGNYKGNVDCSVVAMLEGDWSNKELPNVFFEGMKSVGQDDENGHKIEILSQNKNLWNAEIVKKQDGRKPSYTKNNNIITYSEIGEYGIYVPIKVKKDETLRISGIVKNVQNIRIFKESDNFKGMGIYNRDFNGIETEVSPHYICTFPEDGVYHIRVWCKSTGTPILTDFLAEISSVNTTYVEHKSNKKEILLNEPLRAVKDYKDRVVKINNKPYIERNCISVTYDGTNNTMVRKWQQYDTDEIAIFGASISNIVKSNHQVICDKLKIMTLGDLTNNPNTEFFTNQNGGTEEIGVGILKTKLSTLDSNGINSYLQTNPITVVIGLTTPIYEPLEVEPTLNTYNDITHISNNSIIPCNMKIKNSGYNAIIKPSTLYTVALDTNKAGTIGMNLGGAKGTTTNNVLKLTTPATLTDDSLRICGKGIKGSKVRLLEGDKTNWIPSHFEGMKSSFEDKFDVTDNTYKMEILSNNINLLPYNNVKISPKTNQTWYDINGKSGIYGSNIDKKTDTCFELKEGYYKISIKTVNCGYQIIDTSEKIMNFNGTTLIPKGRYCIRLRNNNTTDEFGYSEGMITYSNTPIVEYTPRQHNKIQFSSIEPLRSVNLRDRYAKDRFVFKDDKLVIERNCKKIVLDGTQVLFKHADQSKDGTSLFGTGDLTPERPSYHVECDSFGSSGNNLMTNTTFANIEGIGCWSARKNFNIRIKTCRLKEDTGDGMMEYVRENPITIIYPTSEPTYEEIPFELQKIILEGYENGTLFFDTNIPPTSTVTYAGETPIVKSVRLNKTEVLNNTNDINDNIIPYLMDMDYRVVCLQLVTEEIEGGVSMARLFGGTYEMLQRDIQSNRYSVDEYRHRLDAYLSANKITEDEYNKLGDMLNE